MKLFDVVQYNLPVKSGKFEDVKHPSTQAILHREPKYDQVPVNAIVIGIHEQDNEAPLLDLAFLHPQRAGALVSADWRDAFDRVFGVRHVSHDDLEDASAAMGFYSELSRSFQFAGPGDYAVEIGEPATTPAEPSAADLDAVAAEEKAKEETSGQ